MTGQFPDLAQDIPEISAAELYARIDAGEEVTVLDTRRPGDFEAWHVSAPNVTAVNVPFTEFLDGDEPAAEVPDGVPEGPLVTCCAVGVSSQYVAEFLAREGWTVEGLADGMRGWATVYDAREVAVDAPATVVQFHRPSSGCLAYLLVSGNEAAVVDPLRAFADEYDRAATERGADLAYAVDTHVHADHVSGVRELGATDATPVMPAGAVDRGLVNDLELLADGDRFVVGSATVEAVALPGHTSEMVGFRVGDALLAGDTVFPDGVARPDLEAGADGAADAARQLYDTLQEIATLPDETILAPAHASDGTPTRDDGTYTARLGDLRDSLAAFEQDREAFVADTVEGMPPRPNNYETIIDANLGRRSLPDEDAFDLELGPNNCAASAPADD